MRVKLKIEEEGYDTEDSFVDDEALLDRRVNTSIHGEFFVHSGKEHIEQVEREPEAGDEPASVAKSLFDDDVMDESLDALASRIAEGTVLHASPLVQLHLTI